jgi:hypothetical protein
LSLETDEEKISAEFRERKERIAKLLLDATRNFPPMKEDISEIFEEIKDLFPELETLKELAVKKESGRMSLFWWDKAQIYGINKKIEQEIKKKPFNPKRAGEVFAYVLWLSFELLFKKDLLELDEEEGRSYEKFKQAQRELRAERIVLNIPRLNTRFKIATGLDDILVFKENVPSFFAKLPIRCTGQDDFSARILNLGSIFDVDLETLRKIVTDTDQKSASIKIIQKWLEEKGIKDQKGVIDTWEKIRLLRNAPPTHPRITPKQLEAFAFFGGSSIVNFTTLWDSILDKFAESLEQFQEIITTV